MTETNRRLKVFLCHAHSDAAAVRDLFRYLRREGVEVWLDKESLLPGVDWDREIRKAVRESDVVVVCLSKQFNQTGYRQREVKLALDTEEEKPEGEIYIIPARLEVCDVPDRLNKWQWVDLFEEGGRQRLIRALRTRAESVGARLRRRRGDKSSGTFSRGEGVLYPAIVDSPVTPDGEIPAPLESHSDRIISLENPETRSGIWVDDTWNVWRDSNRLGKLASGVEYRLLTFLIENRGLDCSLSYMLVEAFDKPIDNLYDIDHLKTVSLAITNIRKLIEEDDEHPKLLVRTEFGYQLDW